MGFSGSCGGSALPVSAPPAQERAAILCLVNAERRARGLHTLAEDPGLERTAQAHTAEMVQRNYISHTGPSGSSPLSRIRGGGYLGKHRRFTYGENIGFGDGSHATPGDIVKGWMSDAVHRSQILNPSFRDSGIGFVARTPSVFGSHGRGAIITQDYGSRH